MPENNNEEFPLLEEINDNEDIKNDPNKTVLVDNDEFTLFIEESDKEFLGESN